MRVGAIEAGGTKMICAVGTEEGEILDRVRIETGEPNATCEKMLAYFQKHEADCLGIGCFGPIELHRNRPDYGSITTTPKLAWQNFNIVKFFEQKLGIPVGFDTDVNAACLGEVVYGNCKGLSVAMYLTIGTGIGAGLWANGSLVHGMLHPEAGHILLGRHPKDTKTVSSCPYHINCFEGLASGPALAKRYGRPAEDLYEIPEVWELESYYIGRALANYIMTFSPERIVLGGGVMHKEGLLEMVRNQVKEALNGYLKTEQLSHMEDYIVPASLGDNQGILGGFCLALQEMQNTTGRKVNA